MCPLIPVGRRSQIDFARDGHRDLDSEISLNRIAITSYRDTRLNCRAEIGDIGFVPEYVLAGE